MPIGKKVVSTLGKSKGKGGKFSSDVMKRIALAASGGIAGGAAGYGTGRIVGEHEKERIQKAFNEYNKRENQALVSRMNQIGQERAARAAQASYRKGQADVVKKIQDMSRAQRQPVSNYTSYRKGQDDATRKIKNASRS